MSGPFHVQGAEPGDALAVHFIDIVPSRPTAVSSLFPHFGALSPTRETAMLADRLPEKVWFYDLDLDRWTARFQALSSDFSCALPLDPIHGTIGAAAPAWPRLENEMSIMSTGSIRPLEDAYRSSHARLAAVAEEYRAAHPRIW